MMGVRVRVAFCVAAAAAFTFDTTHRLQTAGRRVQLSQAQPLLMANNPGALKRIRTNERNRLRNREWRSKVRTWTKKTKDAIAAGDVDAAKECARVATSMIVSVIPTEERLSVCIFRTAQHVATYTTRIGQLEINRGSPSKLLPSSRNPAEKARSLRRLQTQSDKKRLRCKG